MLQDTVVIEGEVSLVSQIDGDPSLLSEVDGDPDVFIGGGGSQPTGTKSILLTEAGTKTEDVSSYASTEINAVKSATASGAVASFSDGAEDVPMDSCVVDIEPVQSGSGDPSPSNVRPISGWSEVNVYVSPTQSAQDATVHTVSLGQTVYGGTLDVVTGVLTVDRAIVDLGTLTWAKRNTSSGRYRFTANTDIYQPSSSAQLPNILCSAYPTISPNDTWTGVFGVSCNTGSAQILVSDENYETATAFKTAMNGVQLVYELATATTVQLTPTEVKTLLGSNNVWADSGDIAVGYKADVYLSEGGVTPTGTKSITITSNGTTTEDVTNYASASITTNVPASAVDTGTKNISTNGTHDVVGYASASVAVPASVVDSGTKSITSNGTHDVIGYASASVAVPNSYSASDEGKVVSNGALVAQTSDTVTQNGTVDTTLIDELTVNVPTGGGGIDINEWVTGTAYAQDTAVITVDITRSDAFSGAPFKKVVWDYSRSSNPNSCQRVFDNGKMEAVIFTGFTGILGSSSSGWFDRCTSLTTFDAPMSGIHASQFSNCSALDTLILRKSSSLCSLASNALNATKFKNGGAGGTIYIPKALYDHLGDGTSLDYKSATNWSTYDGYGTITWAKIEGSAYESTTWWQ